MKVEEIFKLTEANDIIGELQSKRYSKQPVTGKHKSDLDPLKHKVFNHILRPDKKVKIDVEDFDDTTKVTNGVTGEGYRIEHVARIALALQKLIVKRAVSFMFGNPVTIDCIPENDSQTAVFKAIKRVLSDVKEKSHNRRVARTLFSCTEVAELWYPVEKPNNVYGFPSKFKLRCAMFSPLDGDTLYPYFDESGDLKAFSRQFSIEDAKGKVHTFFETYTDEFQMMWRMSADGWKPEEGYPKTNPIGKIPVVFAQQPQVEWEDVQVLIDRLEKLLSNFADTNDYHAAPKIFVKGTIQGFSKKGESGAILEGDADSDAHYLSWANAPESVKLEIDTLLRMIYTITQTPDISFDSVRGVGAISGVALKLLFMDAHLKVQDHSEVFDEYLQRRLNIVKAFIGQFNTKLSSEAEALLAEPVITPYIIKDEAAELKIWSDANGGNAVISQKASFEKANLTSDPDADYQQYQDEQSSKSSFALNEPTLPPA